MRAVFALVERYAASAAPVFITGPTGSGKELVARAIHYHSKRKGKFIAINCASVSESLFESEFFGHKRGSFTGAIADRKGWFEQAAGGTLFLDELGEMPLSQQAKLLRAIQERAVMPVGSAFSVPVTARIVAATNVSMAEAVGASRFREDLFDRLNVLPIQIPALAERPEDFPLLVEHFVRKANTEEGTDMAVPHGETLGAMEQTFGTGSIRVLENAVRRIVLAKRTGRLSVEQLRDVIPASFPDMPEPAARCLCGPDAAGLLEVSVQMKGGTSFKAIIRAVEKAVLAAVLRRHHGRTASAMHELQMTKQVWYRARGS